MTRTAETRTGVAVQLQDLHRAYAGVPALDGLDLALEPGEFVSLLGPSGCGKTTALRVLAGLETADRGQVRVGGRDITGAAGQQARHGHGVPGLQPVPQPHRARQRRLRAAAAGGLRRRPHEAGRGGARAGRARVAGREVPAPDVGRAAAAGGAGPRAGDPPAGAAARRAAVRPGRQGPGAAARGDPPAADRAGDHDAVRHARPGGGARDLRPGRRHVQGPARAARHAGRRSTSGRRRRSSRSSSG